MGVNGVTLIVRAERPQVNMATNVTETERGGIYTHTHTELV